MKKFSFLLASLLLLQSCNVYHSQRLTVAEAVATKEKVLVVTTTNTKFHFKRLEQDGDQVYGVTRPGKAGLSKFANIPNERKGGLLMADISQLKIDEIRLRNNGLSTGLTILTTIVAAAGAWFLILATSMSGSEMKFGSN